MNVLLSLLIYNPLEAYTLILLCNVIAGNNTKFNTKNILVLYLFCAVNFLIQIVPYIFYDSVLYIVSNLFVAYVVTPLILRLVYVKFINKNLTIRQSFVALFIYCVFVIVIPMIMDAIFKTHTSFYNDNNLHEMISNFIIFFVQIISYKFIENRRNYYEKLCKRNF